jgi:hypothetical protein
MIYIMQFLKLVVAGAARSGPDGWSGAAPTRRPRSAPAVRAHGPKV